MQELGLGMDVGIREKFGNVGWSHGARSVANGLRLRRSESMSG